MTIDRPDVSAGCPTCLAINVAGNLLMINQADESLDAFDLATGKKRQVVKKPTRTAGGAWSPTYAVAISPDSGKVLRTQGDFPPTPLILTILDSSSGHQLLIIPVNTEPGILWFPFRSWFSPDGRFVAMFNGSPLHGLVRIWDAATGELLLTRPGTDAVFVSKESVVIDNIFEEVPVEHNLISGVDEKFAEIPDASRLLFPR
jgi:WD40 repeat protein